MPTGVGRRRHAPASSRRAAGLRRGRGRGLGRGRAAGVRSPQEATSCRHGTARRTHLPGCWQRRACRRCAGAVGWQQGGWRCPPSPPHPPCGAVKTRDGEGRTVTAPGTPQPPRASTCPCGAAAARLSGAAGPPSSAAQQCAPHSTGCRLRPPPCPLHHPHPRLHPPPRPAGAAGAVGSRGDRPSRPRPAPGD